MDNAPPALVIVDMQNYYLKRDSSYYGYFNSQHAGCLDYILTRCETTVIPNIRRLQECFRGHSLPVIFLRLCGTDPERGDLHPIFRDTHFRGKRAGFDNLYPLANDPFADVADEIRPLPGETIVNKTTFSPFTATGIDRIFRERGISLLAFTGLATSQCVETTARDASDRGYGVIQIEDAQADYDETTHNASLFSSQGVCGGMIIGTDEYIKMNLV